MFLSNTKLGCFLKSKYLLILPPCVITYNSTLLSVEELGSCNINLSKLLKSVADSFSVIVGFPSKSDTILNLV